MWKVRRRIKYFFVTNFLLTLGDVVGEDYDSCRKRRQLIDVESRDTRTGIVETMLVESTVYHAWSKEKGKQMKNLSKATATPSAELGSQVLTGEELSGDEEHWHERRKTDLPKVDMVKTDQWGKWLGTSTEEHMDQPNHGQSSMCSLSNRSFCEIPDISSIDGGITHLVPLPMSPIDIDTLDQVTTITEGHSNIKKQNLLGDKMTGKLTQTPSAGRLETSSWSSSATTLRVMPSSCQVDEHDNNLHSKADESVAPQISETAPIDSVRPALASVDSLSLVLELFSRVLDGDCKSILAFKVGLSIHEEMCDDAKNFVRSKIPDTEESDPFSFIQNHNRCVPFLKFLEGVTDKSYGTMPIFKDEQNKKKKFVPETSVQRNYSLVSRCYEAALKLCNFASLPPSIFEVKDDHEHKDWIQDC